MMSKKQWLALLTLFILYLLLGAALFHHIESELEIERRKDERKERLEIQALLTAHYAVDSPNSQAEIMRKLSGYCGRPMFASYNGTGVEDFEPFVWDFYNSVFFVITVVSTIGYGNLSPSSALGRLLMILYALIGIPMNGIVLATLAEFFSTALRRVHRRYKTKQSETRAGLVADIILYLIPGFVIFIFLPTGVFMHFEGWTFDESLYYAFVTLTTIGFGDFVAGQTDKGSDSEVLHMLYKALLLIWIVFGLGYLVMLLGFITRAMRSKRMARLEHKLATNLKQTQSKIWSSFTRDVSYLRRILNEMYVMRLKPVYKDEEPAGYHIRTRSSSEPMLYALPEKDQEPAPGFGVWRRRANSETAAALRLPRVLSESDLERIDREATFKSAAALIEPGELLAHVVNALGCEEQGIQGFSDAEILSSEDQGTTWSIGDEAIPRQRGRAASEVRIPMREQQSDAEWTWSGDQPSRRVHELIRARHKSMVPPDTSGRRPSIFQIAAARLKHPLKKRHKAKSIGDLFGTNTPPHRRQSVQPEEQNYFTHTSMHPALEETSLADFLRAMNSLHSRVATPPDSAPPRRKAGTASLTPPGSLLSLFTPPNLERRMSLRPTPVPRLHSAAMRRASLHPAIRRFSVRPATSTLPPPPPPPPPPLRLMAPHLFSRQISDPTHRRRASSITDRK